MTTILEDLLRAFGANPTAPSEGMAPRLGISRATDEHAAVASGDPYYGPEKAAAIARATATYAAMGRRVPQGGPSDPKKEPQPIW